MDMNSGIIRISEALAAIPWETWHPPLAKLLERRSHKDMGDVPARYPPGTFITLMAMAGLNDYRTIGKAEFGYWPRFWRHVKEMEVPDTPIEMSNSLKSFYREERFFPAKLARLHRFLSSHLADVLWNMEPKQVADELPDLWRTLAATMGQECEAKTIAFAPRTIGSALRILGVDEFNYKDIPIPVDSRIRQLTPNLPSDDAIRTFWEYVLRKIHLTKPRVSMYHLDAFLWPYAGEVEKKAWLMSHGIDEDTSKVIACAFEEIAEVQLVEQNFEMKGVQCRQGFMVE